MEDSDSQSLERSFNSNNVNLFMGNSELDWTTNEYGQGNNKKFMDESTKIIEQRYLRL